MVKGHKTASEMAQKNYKAFLVEESEEPSHGEEPSQFRLTCSLESSVRLKLNAIDVQLIYANILVKDSSKRSNPFLHDSSSFLVVAHSHWYPEM